MKFFIWKDIDKDNFSIGIKTSTGRYIAWTNCHIDGIGEIFGRKVENIMKESPAGKPVEFISNIEIVG